MPIRPAARARAIGADGHAVGLGLSRSETIAYARSVIDIVVQFGREGAQRKIVAIEQLTPVVSLLSMNVRKLASRAA